MCCDVSPDNDSVWVETCSYMKAIFLMKWTCLTDACSFILYVCICMYVYVCICMYMCVCVCVNLTSYRNKAQFTSAFLSHFCGCFHNFCQSCENITIYCWIKCYFNLNIKLVISDCTVGTHVQIKLENNNKNVSYVFLTRDL
jgi:hypothetical protein